MREKERILFVVIFIHFVVISIHTSHTMVIGQGSKRFRKKGEMMNDYFTLNELAKEFRVNPKTIYRRLWAKGIPAYKIGRSWKNCEEGYQVVEAVTFSEGRRQRLRMASHRPV